MKRSRFRRGVATIWFGIVGLALVGLFSFTIDFARVRFVHHQLQVTADAAALAGAGQITTGTNKQQKLARTAAVDVASKNFAADQTKGVVIRRNDSNDPEGDVVMGVFDPKTRIFKATTTSPNAVKVNARRTSDSPGGALKLIFGSFWGTSSSNITGTAIAIAATQGPAGITLLDSTAAPGLSVTSSGSLNVIGGTIQVNSSAPDAVSMTGSGSITADAINVVGSMVQTGSSSVSTVNTGAPAVQDPLAGLAALKAADVPAQTLPSTDPNGSTNVTLEAGYYAQPVVYQGSQTVTLKRGTYVFEQGFTLTGNASLDGSAGVMLYAINGPITLTGNGGIQLKTLNDGTPYSNIGIYMDRNNTSTVTLTGNGGVQVGTVYAPSSPISLTGDAKFGELGIVTLIAAKASISGNGSVTVLANAGGGTATPITLVN